MALARVEGTLALHDSCITSWLEVFRGQRYPLFSQKNTSAHARSPCALRSAQTQDYPSFFWGHRFHEKCQSRLETTLSCFAALEVAHADYN